MIMLDVIQGHTTLVIEIVWSGLDGMDSCHREDDCDTSGKCHLRVYFPIC